MNLSNEITTSNSLLSKIINTRYVIIAIVIDLALGETAIQVAPSNYLQEHLFTQTVPIISAAGAICYLWLVYTPKQASTINTGKLIYYCLGGIILWATINFPHVSWNTHVKPEYYALFISYGVAAKTYYLLMLCVVGPIVEEIFFRRYIYSMIRDDFNIPTGVIVSSALFMLSHNLNITPQSWLYLFIPGVICALVYEKTKTIWASIAVHGFSNLIWFSLVYYA